MLNGVGFEIIIKKKLMATLTVGGRRGHQPHPPGAEPHQGPASQSCGGAH